MNRIIIFEIVVIIMMAVTIFFATKRDLLPVFKDFPLDEEFSSISMSPSYSIKYIDNKHYVIVRVFSGKQLVLEQILEKK